MWNTKQKIEFIKKQIIKVEETMKHNDAEYYKQELVNWTDLLKDFEGE